MVGKMGSEGGVVGLHSNQSLDSNNGMMHNPIIMRSGFELLCDYTPIINSVRSRCVDSFKQREGQQHESSSPQGATASSFISASVPPSISLLNQIIITGEGRFDSQSLDGKVVDRVCSLIAKGESVVGDDLQNNHNNHPNTTTNETTISPKSNIPVIVLCGSNGFENCEGGNGAKTITNPNLVHFPQSLSPSQLPTQINIGLEATNALPPQSHCNTTHNTVPLASNSNIMVNGDNEENISNQLGQLNIVKIIDINNTRFHPTIQPHSATTSTSTPSPPVNETTTSDTMTLEYKLAHGIDNLTKVGLFLRQLLDQTASNNDVNGPCDGNTLVNGSEQQTQQEQEQLAVHNHIIRFITALRQID